MKGKREEIRGGKVGEVGRIKEMRGEEMMRGAIGKVKGNNMREKRANKRNGGMGGR